MKRGRERKRTTRQNRLRKRPACGRLRDQKEGNRHGRGDKGAVVKDPTKIRRHCRLAKPDWCCRLFQDPVPWPFLQPFTDEIPVKIPGQASGERIKVIKRNALAQPTTSGRGRKRPWGGRRRAPRFAWA